MESKNVHLNEQRNRLRCTHKGCNLIKSKSYTFLASSPSFKNLSSLNF